MSSDLAPISPCGAALRTRLKQCQHAPSAGSSSMCSQPPSSARRLTPRLAPPACTPPAAPSPASPASGATSARPSSVNGSRPNTCHPWSGAPAASPVTRCCSTSTVPAPRACGHTPRGTSTLLNHAASTSTIRASLTTPTAPPASRTRAPSRGGLTGLGGGAPHAPPGRPSCDTPPSASASAGTWALPLHHSVGGTPALRRTARSAPHRSCSATKPSLATTSCARTVMPRREIGKFGSLSSCTASALSAISRSSLCAAVAAVSCSRTLRHGEEPASLAPLLLGLLLDHAAVVVDGLAVDTSDNGPAEHV
eukprot:scaffold36747_cov63-Phaeocystis_antarctica.AAC.3